MRRNHYETMVIINAGLDDAQIESVIEKVTNFIKNNSGENCEVEKWGRKRLAFPIKKNRIGFYVVYRFTADVTLIKELDRLFRLDESVIRYLTITLTKKALEHFADQKSKLEREKAEQAEREAAEQTKAESTEEKPEKPEDKPAVEKSEEKSEDKPAVEKSEEKEEEKPAAEKEEEKPEGSGDAGSDDEKEKDETQDDEDASDTKKQI